MALKRYGAGCLCGAVRIEAHIDLGTDARRCNCSDCAKGRNWFVIVRAPHFHVVAGDDAQTEYRWIPADRPDLSLHYSFCLTCGVPLYLRGEHTSADGRYYALNVALLDDVAAEPAERRGVFAAIDVGDTYVFRDVPGPRLHA